VVLKWFQSNSTQKPSPFPLSVNLLIILYYCTTRQNLIIIFFFLDRRIEQPAVVANTVHFTELLLPNLSIVTMSTPEERNQMQLAKCNELCSNDPFVTKPVRYMRTILDLPYYGKIEWEDAFRVAEALKMDTLLVKLTLSLKKEHLCVDGYVLFTHYLSSSPSLR
jgi:hypothetical protein